MFRSVNSKFYAIAILMMISFSIGYVLLIYFLNQQSENFISSRDIAIIEKDVNKLNELFHQTRFCEKVIFSQMNPEAEMQYGIILKKARSLLSDLNKKELNETTKFNLDQIVEQINQYEINFNQLIQLKTKKKLVNTRMETNYRSMTSIILISNDPKLLKPMFNLTHFLIAYNTAITLNKFQALNLVIDSFEKKIKATETLDVRMQGYLNNFRELLSEDYLIELDMIAINKAVESITAQIQDSFTNISSELEMRLKRKIQETKQIKQDLKNIFLIFGISGCFILLFVLYLFLKNIITPIRSISLVMKKVQEGNLEARFVNHTKNKDDIVQLGFSFNDMLETLKINNKKVLNYQKVLENKIDEITRQKIETQDLTERLHNSQKMESIGTLAGGIAHDFNNILSPILGYTEMLLMDVPEDGHGLFKENLNQIYTSALRAKSLVKQILTFARQESGELILMKIQTIVKEVLKLIRSTIPTTIEIEQDINPDCGVIKADPTQIHQIVMNLSTNAYHAMEETGGVLKVSLKEVELGKYDIMTPDMTPGVYACLIVADTGIGMNKELIKKIFDPFFTTKELGKGTGMGLSVAHGIVNKMGGTIQVHSEPGKGTQFHVYLPVADNSPEEQASHPISKIQGGTEHIILVDDEEAILKMEKRLLERLGYKVTSRFSSLEALKSFRESPYKFDLIITDMAMPNMSGDKLSVELAKIRPDIPVLLCTGFSETMSEEKSASLGIKGFLLKPIVMKDLARKIREVLDKKRILIIDDEPQIRLMLKEMLEREGFDIIVASDGKEGMELFEKYPVDLVITDIIMPEKEGIEIILALREGYPDVPIIAISGGGKNPPAGYLKTAKFAGAQATFEKPIKKEELLNAIKKALEFK